MTKSSIYAIASLAMLPLATTALAGDMVIMPQGSVTDPGRSLKSAIQSITNPTLHESAVPQTRIRGMVINHQTPDFVSTGGVGNPVAVAPNSSVLNSW